MNNIGLCLWTFGDITLEEKMRNAASIGVDGVEIEGDLSVSPLEVRRLLDEYKLLPLSITPNNVNLVSTDESIREASVEYYHQLIDWAQEISVPRLTVHGEVGLIQSQDYQRDYLLLVDAVKRITAYANTKNLEVVFEVLNRYESYQIRTAQEALQLIQDVDDSKLKVLLDSYHMNIEESNPSQAILATGSNLGVYHIADSNRLGMGHGSIDFKSQFDALKEIDYSGPLIMEISASGPNPFTAVKDGEYISELVNEYKITLEKTKEIMKCKM